MSTHSIVSKNDTITSQKLFEELNFMTETLKADPQSSEAAQMKDFINRRIAVVDPFVNMLSQKSQLRKEYTQILNNAKSAVKPPFFSQKTVRVLYAAAGTTLLGLTAALNPEEALAFVTDPLIYIPTAALGISLLLGKCCRPKPAAPKETEQEPAQLLPRARPPALDLSLIQRPENTGSIGIQVESENRIIVEPGSVASRSGLISGDILIDPTNFSKIQIRAGEPVTLTVRGSNGRPTYTVKLTPDLIPSSPNEIVTSGEIAPDERSPQASPKITIEERSGSPTPVLDTPIEESFPLNSTSLNSSEAESPVETSSEEPQPEEPAPLEMKRGNATDESEVQALLDSYSNVQTELHEETVAPLQTQASAAPAAIEEPFIESEVSLPVIPEMEVRAAQQNENFQKIRNHLLSKLSIISKEAREKAEEEKRTVARALKQAENESKNAASKETSKALQQVENRIAGRNKKAKRPNLKFDPTK